MICLRKLLMVVLLSTFGILFYVSDSWARVFDDESVCNGAVVLNESNIKTWTTDYRFYEYVKEAKRRGLNCGIKSKEITKVAKQSTLPNCPKSGYKQNCYGSILYAHGGKYNGEWKNNFEHGFGEYAYSNGDKYIGNFKYGKKEGKGTFYFNDGSIYEGNYKDDQMNGKGSLTNINKEKYFGNFKENKKHGKGIIIKPNGSRKEVTFNYGFLNTDNKKRVKNKLADTSDEMLCFYATVGYASWDLTNPNYVNEAKRRGLDCGVEDDEAEKKRIAEELTHKKKLQEEKERKKKLAAEKARKNKLAEENRKRKLAQQELNTKIKDYKRKAKNFYKDIEEFVKAGGNVDLVSLSDYFDIKPNPKNKWNKSDLSQYEELRNFMVSIPQFVSFEKERIGERLKNSFAMKDQSIADLEKNLSELKGLMRKMFGSSEIPKIKSMIKDIQSILSNFNQSKANKVLKQSSTYIASKFPKQKIQKKTVGVTTDDWKKYKSQTTPQQQQFCTLTKRFFKDLQKAETSRNEIMVNMVHKERQENLDALIPQGNINNWIFKVIKIDQVQDGSAAVILSLPCKSFIGSGQVHTQNTWIKKSEKEWRATIPYNDRRFRELAKLAKGEFVLASGILLEVEAFKPGQIETFYASQQIGEHPLTKGLNLEGELFIADLSYIAALN